MAELLNPAAPHHLPSFITAPGETDVLMVVMGFILLLGILMFGILFLRLHSLPERVAHKSHKIQFEIVAVLCLIALFTHMHIFWVAGLLLAMIDVPDFGGSLARIARSAEKIADVRPGEGAVERRRDHGCHQTSRRTVAVARGPGAARKARRRIADKTRHPAGEKKELIHARASSLLLVTIFPDYLFRRYVQGRRFGKEITFYSVWFELRWGITACLILTVSLITVIFYNHPSTTNVTLFFRTVPIVPETNGRVAEVYCRKRSDRPRSADLQAGQLEAGGRRGDRAAQDRRSRRGDAGGAVRNIEG